MSSSPLRAAVVFGTRPEAVKLLPVIRGLAADPRFQLRVFVTGQHREMVDEILAPFGVVPDVDLGLMSPGQTLNQIVSRAMPALDRLLADEQPELVMVQGDTTSAFCAALAAFHRRIVVAHLEAGLRSFDRFHPYPEEANRRMVSAVADLHFAPTAVAASCLAAERVPAADVFITGNTVIDALLLALSTQKSEHVDGARPLVLITLHRREGWDAPGALPIEDVLAGIRAAADRRPDVEFVYPVHPNPRVREPATRLLGGADNVRLRDPIPYLPFVALMARARVIITDSGGIQEEAPSLGIPVLVPRRTTERPEGLAAGGNRLVGLSSDTVRDELCDALERPPRPREGVPYPSPFGDGRAQERVRDALLHRFGRGPRPADFDAQSGGPT